MFTKMTTSLFILLSLTIANVSANDYKSGFVDNQGVKLHYLEKKQANSKQKPALLFVPGLSMPGWIWEKQLDYFSKNYTVVAMDPRSQGDSPQTSEGQYQKARAGDIKAVVDQLQLKPVILIGWSLAVSEAVAYLSEFGSDGIAGIVLVDGFAGLYPNSPSLNMMFDYWSKFQLNRIPNTQDFVEGMFHQPQSKEYLTKLTNASFRTPTSTLMALIYNLIIIDYRPTLPSIKVPALVITVDKPWQQDVKEMQEKIPNSKLVIIPEAAHAVFVDQPEQFNSALDKFFEGF